jgi:fructose-1,6-bisphosphatase II
VVSICRWNTCSELTVLMLDRPRHAELIAQVREAGARIRLISDGDVGGAIETAKIDAPVDIMLGIGGACLVFNLVLHSCCFSCLCHAHHPCPIRERKPRW